MSLRRGRLDGWAAASRLLSGIAAALRSDHETLAGASLIPSSHLSYLIHPCTPASSHLKYVQAHSDLH